MEPSFVGFLVFAIICLSTAQQMQSGAAISCDIGETITTAKVSTGDECRKELQTNCGLQGRVVSHLEMNAPDPKNTKQKVCEGCCQVPLPCPPQPPAKWTQCPATDTDKTFKIENYSGNDCRRCQDGCKSRCDSIGNVVGDQICGYLTKGKAFVGLYCTCCCRKKAVYPPPPPPSPSPPPPPPPSPPPIALSCDYGQAQAIARHDCKGQDTSFCQEKCQSLSTALVLGNYGCERNAADPTNSYCICCYELDVCDSGSSLSSFSSNHLFKALQQ